MKLLAFSDTHLDEYALREIITNAGKADLVICAGDLSRMGTGLKKMIMELSTIKKEVLIVPGNNDPVRQTQELCQEYGLTFIHKASIKRKKLIFSGVGGSTGSVGIFTLTEQQIKKLLNKFKNTNVLISHAPPHGPLGDTGRDNIGSKSILEFIKKEQPSLCLCGHCHEHAGEEIKISETRVINVSKHGIIIKM